MSSNQKITFWKFLNENIVEIPIIQRDYAQGRNGKEKLREKFLGDLKAALDSQKDEKKSLKLDFVYGSVENGKLNPLDGQQRLTTLWLLHWFIAYKAEVLSKNNAIFKKFTYETRISSREFCDKLSDFSDPQPEGVSIVDHIQNQTWFYSAWKQDPTIQAMLNMLGGTKQEDKEIIDGIEECFDAECDYNGYWNKLTSDDCPIIFYYTPLNELKLSDDLYIKMNARGKALTNFENFKADMVGFIKHKINEVEVWNDENLKKFEHKLDTTWTDIFWRNKSSDYKIDEIYFAFFNRYFLNRLITAKKEGNYLFTGEDLEKSNKYYKFFSGNDCDKYSVYEMYNPKNGSKEIFDLDFYLKLSDTLDNIHSVFEGKSKDYNINLLLNPAWDGEDFCFIPKYDDNDNTKRITQKQRVVFHAICCYFEKGKYDEISLKQWMRVVWNIVENSGIETAQAMIGAMRLINDLAENSHGIYIHLKDRDVEKDFAKDQMKEEKEKASQIIKEETWEVKIIEAEKIAFSKGAIRFMFTNENGDYNWSLFDDRLRKSQLYFDEKGIAEMYEKDAILLRLFICGFTKWEQFWGIAYSSKSSEWKKILTNKEWLQPIYSLFDLTELNEDAIRAYSLKLDTTEELNNYVHSELCKSKLLNKIISYDCVLNWRNKYVLYKPHANANYNKFVIDKRNEILSRLIDNGIITECKQKVVDLPYFWGWEIEFKCKDNNWYQWWDTLKIWHNDKQQYEEISVENKITIDTLEDYLQSL